MNRIYLLCAVFLVCCNHTGAIVREKNLKKRQIYREQVLPHAGGKIPDTAFQTDRLLLNRLQKNGIAIPDGVILEQRNPEVHPHYHKTNRAVYRVAATFDPSYTYPAGRYLHHEPPSIETTYLVPQVHNHVPKLAPPPLWPKYRPIHFPNNALLDRVKPTPAPKKSYYVVAYDTTHPSGGKQSSRYVNYYNTGPSSNSVSWSQITQDYVTSQIFNDFHNFFNSHDARHIRNTEKTFRRKQR